MIEYYNITTQEISRRPVIEGIDNPTHAEILDNGWYIYSKNVPYGYDTSLYIIEMDDIYVVDEYKTAIQQYILVSKPVDVPSVIIFPQAVMQLKELSSYDEAVSYVEGGDDDTLKAFWDKGYYWNIDSPTVISLLEYFEIDINQFFIDANSITI
jgi:hypothetical protein